jgi:predicted small lipoprotein YifL
LPLGKLPKLTPSVDFDGSRRVGAHRSTRIGPVISGSPKTKTRSLRALAATAIVAAALLLTLAGCGGSDSTSTPPAAAKAAPRPHLATAADVREARQKSRRLRKLYEESWREYQNGR